MKRDWLFDPAEAHQFSPYRPVCFAFHSDYSVSPPNNKISRLHHLITPLPRCLRFTASITVYSTRLAIVGWLDLTEQDSHLLDYPPFVWAHKQNLKFSYRIIKEKGLLTSNNSEVNNIAIVTDSFHQFRARIIASKLKNSYGIKTKLGSVNAKNGRIGITLYPTFFVREWIAIPFEIFK